MEIAKGIHHLDSGPFNWYLIEENGRFTLVDAGYPGHHQVYTKGPQSLGKPSKDIEGIVPTDSQADHIGFAEKVRKETGVPVFVHKEDAKMACKPLQLPWFVIKFLGTIYSKNVRCCNRKWLGYVFFASKISAP